VAFSVQIAIARDSRSIIALVIVLWCYVRLGTILLVCTHLGGGVVNLRSILRMLAYGRGGGGKGKIKIIHVVIIHRRSRSSEQTFRFIIHLETVY
jgi:hypothetical protein